jgi:hypothetical protein
VSKGINEMSQTIYASFADVEHAEKAAGALLDYGVQKDDISLVANNGRTIGQEQEVGSVYPAYDTDVTNTGVNYDSTEAPIATVPAFATTGPIEPQYATSSFNDPTRPLADLPTDRYGSSGFSESDNRADVYDNSTTSNTVHDSGNSDAVAKSGITTTTADDAGVGALKGTGIGLGIGILAGLASLIVPGVGLVIGGGALAGAIGAAALTTGAGAVAGGVVGYLKDQGVAETDAVRYEQALGSGGALLAVNLPSNGVDLQSAEVVLNKYGATDIRAY